MHIITHNTDIPTGDQQPGEATTAAAAAAAALTIAPQETMAQMLADPNNSNTSNSDPFGPDAAPIMYMSENRTPAMVDTGLVLVAIIALYGLLVTILLLPSIRSNKWRNFLCLTMTILVGASIPLSIMKNTWMVGELELSMVPYDSLFKNQFSGLIRVDIGLKSMNVTLVGKVTTVEGTASASEDGRKQETTKYVHYNERFHFEQPDGMQLEHEAALKRGLPYPILSVSEFFSHDSEGFNWTRQIRQAGFYTNLLLYVALALWFVAVFLMCALPAYFIATLKLVCLINALTHLHYLIYACFLMPSTIVIYGNMLTIGLNLSNLIAALLSVAALFIAHRIEANLEQDPSGQLTVLDSEDYLKDKQMLGSNATSAFPIISSLTFKKESPKSTTTTTTTSGSGSVIIPIGDIEEKFAPESRVVA